MNLFATALTYTAPAANYRGENEENRAIIQKVTRGRFEYAIISPEAVRNALRETLRSYGLPTNRERLDNQDQLAVKFKEYPDAEKFADDFYFGYLMALKEKERKDLEKAKGKGHPAKRDGVLRMNLAVALEPYRHDAVFTQSPLNVESPWKNADQSALLHREVSVTPFQYPFAINLDDCRLDDPTKKGWFTHLLKAVSELNDVAGNHARSYFEMAPASIVLRLTRSRIAGYDTYGFRSDGSFPEIVDGILAGDNPGDEFYLGGLLVREVLPAEKRKALEARGAHLFRMAAQALDAVSKKACGQGFIPA